jgi:hypothetical protein
MILFCAVCTNNLVQAADGNGAYGPPSYIGDDWEDGLVMPVHVEYSNAEDEDGMVYGIIKKETFSIDMNNDGEKAEVTRGRFDTGTAHGYTFYEMKLQDGKKLDIPDFRTVEGADCFLQAYKFYFAPFFIRKAYRPLGEESWIQPTQSKIEEYRIIDGKIQKISEIPTPPVCDVRELL